jgi:hypothetical protein
MKLDKETRERFGYELANAPINAKPAQIRKLLDADYPLEGGKGEAQILYKLRKKNPTWDVSYLPWKSEISRERIRQAANMGELNVFVRNLSDISEESIKAALNKDVGESMQIPAPEPIKDKQGVLCGGTIHTFEEMTVDQMEQYAAQFLSKAKELRRKEKLEKLREAKMGDFKKKLEKLIEEMYPGFDKVDYIIATIEEELE